MPNLRDLVSVDGSLINATLSMTWADYREKAKKAKVHIGFNINQSIPSKIYLTHGKGDERPFVERIVTKGVSVKGFLDIFCSYSCNLSAKV